MLSRRRSIWAANDKPVPVAIRSAPSRNVAAQEMTLMYLECKKDEVVAQAYYRVS
jgi:hypothetical protein